MNLLQAFFFLVSTVPFVVADQNLASASDLGYQNGDTIKFECLDWFHGNWTNGPTCKETGEELAITFGTDNFLYCGLDIADQQTYDALVQMAKLEKTWQCRVPMSPARDFYVPFTIPIWGVVEDDHFHLDNHLNFIFHVEKGKIIAASVYPVRDRFQFGKVGSLISLHGPVRWFQRHAFHRMFDEAEHKPQGKVLGDGNSQPGEAGMGTTIAFCILSSLVTLLGTAVLYQRKLKPQLIKKCMKNR